MRIIFVSTISLISMSAKDNPKNKIVQTPIRMPEEVKEGITAISGHETVKQSRKVSENETMCDFLAKGIAQWNKANPGKLNKK